MKLFLILSMFVFIPAAFATANFSGQWVAKSGTVSSNIGLHSDCSRVGIEIEQTETEIVVKKYKSTCALFGAEWGPNRMEIRGGKVYEGGQEVGTIDDTTLISITPDGTQAYAFNLRLVKASNGEIQLESYYGVKNAVGAIATEAVLRKTQ